MSKLRDKSSILLIVAILALVAAAVVIIIPQLYTKATVRLGDGVFELRVAHDPASRTKGLSGVDEVAVNSGLLMVFPSDDYWKIWMKDMKVPIDIVWLDTNKKVVHIVKNASFEDPETIYTPKSAARYVIELREGTVNSRTIRIGQTAVFDDPNGSVR